MQVTVSRESAGGSTPDKDIPRDMGGGDQGETFSSFSEDSESMAQKGKPM